MNNKFAAFALSGVFLCTMSVHSFAARSEEHTSELQSR